MSRIALIDLSGVFRRLWHAMEEEETSAVHRRTIQAVQGYAHGFDHVAVCVDRPPYRRKEILPEYKAQRDKPPTVLIETIRAVEAELDALGYHIVGSKGDEADDAIATLTEWSVKEGHEVEIFSADKDLMQLVRPTVGITSTATNQRYGVDEVTAKFGVGPDQVGDLLALCGDKSDNVPGIPGCGPKTAAKWLSVYPSVEAMLAEPSTIPERFRPWFVEPEKVELLTASWRCVQLKDDCPIDCETILTRKAIKAMSEETEEMERNEETETEPTVEHASATPAAPKTQAIAVATAEPVPWERALEPTDPGSAFRMAKMMHEGRAFGDYANPAVILSVVMTGRSLGVDSMAALRSFHVIKGRVSPSAQLLIGLVKKHPCSEYFQYIEGDDKSATWETQRTGEPKPTRMTYTIEMAQRAGLLGNDNWKKRPETMLQWRAGVGLARVAYPDIVSGLYTPEEIEELS